MLIFIDTVGPTCQNLLMMTRTQHTATRTEKGTGCPARTGECCFGKGSTPSFASQFVSRLVLAVAITAGGNAALDRTADYHARTQTTTRDHVAGGR